MHQSRRSRKWTSWLACVAGMAMSLNSVSCSRTFWRTQADEETYQAITEHLTDQRWAVPRIDITPDPRSRFYDPYDPDSAPLPPDDPAAHVYMHWVDGWEGYKCWHKFGDMMSVENPQWLAQFGMTPEMIDEKTGRITEPVPQLEEVSLQEAVELSLIHSRDYQFELEDLFLFALDVTFERFQLGVQYLEPTGGVSESLTEGGGSGLFNVNSIGLSQSLPWGTQLVASLANTTLWSFGAGGQSSSVSTMSFQILQPLLNDAGRKVNLENLTQAERSLLYQSRDLARFRKVLFSSVVSDYLNLLLQVQAIRNERGNIVRSQEQVERLQSETAPSSFSSNVEWPYLPEDWAPPAELQGKLRYSLGRLIWRGLMSPEEEEFLRNLPELQGFNIEAPELPGGFEVPPALQDNLDYRLDRLIWHGPLSPQDLQALQNIPQFQGIEFPVGQQPAVDELKESLPSAASGIDVLQIQTNLTTSVNNLRQLEGRLQDRLDEFKIRLGLPPDMSLTLDERLLEPFEVIDEEFTRQEQIIEDFVGVLYIDNAEQQENLKQITNEFRALLTDVRTNVLDQLLIDVQEFEENLPGRMQELDRYGEEVAKEQLQLAYNQGRDRYQSIVSSFDEIERSTRSMINELQRENLSEDERIVLLGTLRNLREDLLVLVQSATVIQVSARVELIEVADFDMSLQDVERIAVEQRLDLMNARARVMDARRRVEVIANDLRMILDLGLDGSISTNPGEADPFDFRSDTGQLTASLSFDTPLNQISERNAYRQALINYQRERRNYMQIEDNIKADVRTAWRQLDILRRNLETARVAVRIAALQFEAAVSEVNAPQTGQGGGRGGGNQGQQLSNALEAILRAQNQLASNYVSYEVNRLNIYRDMGIMEIGPDGLWNDEVYQNLELKNEDNRVDEQASTTLRQIDGLDRIGGAPDWLGGGGVRNQDAESGVVELRDVRGGIGERPGQPADRPGNPRAVSSEFIGPGKPR